MHKTIFLYIGSVLSLILLLEKHYKEFYENWRNVDIYSSMVRES